MTERIVKINDIDYNNDSHNSNYNGISDGVAKCNG